MHTGSIILANQNAYRNLVNIKMNRSTVDHIQNLETCVHTQNIERPWNKPKKRIKNAWNLISFASIISEIIFVTISNMYW